MLRDLLSLIFPNNCLNCQTSLISEERYLCTTCKIDLPETKDHLNPHNELFQKFAFERKIKSASAFLYFHKGGVAQKLLHEVKYRSKSDLAVQLGEWYSETLDDYTNVDFIAPVPLHKSKRRKRTFNQSEKIAEGLSKSLQLPIKSDIIARTKITRTQTRKKKTQRWLNMENVYSTPSEGLIGKSVLVVDDVITTGATIGMFCQRLVEANVEEIHLLCIARGK